MENDPTARTLTLLTLLQPGTEWTATALADRLGVSARTVRRDVDRLRRLGYVIHARPGPSSAYRLGPGHAIPPLLFTADEVAVITAGLHLIAPHLRGDNSAAVALAKLDQVLPHRLRRRAAAVDLALEVLGDEYGVTAQTVGTVADAVAESGRIRFTYRNGNGVSSVRVVDPHRHVHREGRWYLVGFDLDRDDWRAFRFDRISAVDRIPGTYRRREFPEESAGRWFDTDFGRVGERRRR